MVYIVKIESNEADGQDSSVHSFFYYLLNFNTIENKN